MGAQIPLLCSVWGDHNRQLTVIEVYKDIDVLIKVFNDLVNRVSSEPPEG